MTPNDGNDEKSREDKTKKTTTEEQCALLEGHGASNVIIIHA